MQIGYSALGSYCDADEGRVIKISCPNYNSLLRSCWNTSYYLCSIYKYKIGFLGIYKLHFSNSLYKKILPQLVKFLLSCRCSLSSNTAGATVNILTLQGSTLYSCRSLVSYPYPIRTRNLLLEKVRRTIALRPVRTYFRPLVYESFITYSA